MDFGLQGKRAIVTGGSRGIGKAIARELAREGVDVAIVARTKGDLEATARELAAATNRRIVPLVADVTSKEQVDRMVAEAGDACTVVSDVISGRPCRYIRNKLIVDLEASGLEPLPVPAQQSLTQRLGDSEDREWTALTSGQSAALARATKAAELVERLAHETTRRLRAFA